MRILFITEQFPYPLDNGGNVRTFNLLKGLATSHEVTLIALAPTHPGGEDLRTVARLCREVRLVPPAPGGTLREAWLLLSSTWNGESFVLARHAFAAFGAEIAKAACHYHAAADGGYDVVHFNHLDTAIYEPLVPPDALRVLDEHNVVTNQVATTARLEPGAVRRVVLRQECRRLKRIEAKLCNRMDCCLVCSAPDAQSLRTLGVESRVEVVPNGVDLNEFAPGGESPAGEGIVFVGSLDYDPCEKGVWFFCTEILPRIRRFFPDMRFVVVGRNPSLRLRRLAELDDRIVITGRVGDVRSYVHAARVSVVPLLSGSGTRLKILESLAAGTPVVTTGIGVEGIEAVPGEHLLVADRPDDFAEAVRSVMESDSLARRLRDQGRKLVESKYDWLPIRRRLLNVYQDLSRISGDHVLQRARGRHAGP
jgi:polysaccharide biosynthesis protein PslH